MQSSRAIKTLNNRVVTPPLSHLDKSRFLAATCTALLFSLIFTQSVTAQTISNKTVAVGSSITIDLDAVFSPAAGSSLTYTATTTAVGIVKVSVDGSVLTVTGVAAGPGGGSSSQIVVTPSVGQVVPFQVTVTASAEAPAITAAGITAIDTVLNRASEAGIICITFDGDVTFDASFLNAGLDNFVLSGASPALTVTKFAGRCFVDGRTRSNTIQLTLNRKIAFGETVTLSYTKTGDEHDTKGIRKVVGGAVLADFSNQPVMNNAIQGLDLRLAQTFTQANKILLTFGIEQVTTSSDLRAADFVVSGAASNPVVTGISNKNVRDGDLGSSALVLTLSKNIVGGEDILLSYTKTAGSFIKGHTEGELENFTGYSVTNHRPLPPLPVISISAATVTATAGTAITPISITSTGGAVASYSIMPAITNGLSFDASTGTISGTPDAAAAAVTYTITATNTAGTATATVAITVNAAPLTPESAKQLNEEILPRLIHTMLGGTVSAVNGRMDDTFSGTPQVASYQFDGQTVQLDSQTGLSANLQNTVAQKLPNYIESLKDDAMDWKEMLSRSSFVMPLNAVDGVAAGTGATVWGSGDYSNLSGKVGDGDWKGDVLSLQLGIDQRLRNDLLVGGLVSWSKGDVDYTLGKGGDYTHQITSVHPYFARSSGDVDLWGSVGYGQGKRTIKQQGATNELSNDTRLLSLSAGGSGRLSQSGLNLKSDIILAQVDIAASADKKIPADKLSSQRLRLLLEMGKERPLSSGGHFKPLLEVGLRYDGGVGESSGIGAVLNLGGRYANTTGLTVEGKLHTLLGQDDYQEWGIQGTIRQQANANGQGLSFSLNPSYGTVGISTNQVWQQELADDNNGTSTNSASLDVNMGYGLSVAGGNGLLTPYSEVSMSDSNHYRLGLRWKPSSPLSLHLYGERETSNNSDRILLEGRIRF